MIIGLGLTLRATLLGSTAVSDPYEVAGFSPSLVFDFAEEFYRTGGSTTTFDAAMTHSRSGNATMVDSDGLLKWAPHNLLLRSEEFDNAAWVNAAGTVNVTANTTTAPNGTLTADKLAPAAATNWMVKRQIITLTAVSHVLSVFAKLSDAGVHLELYCSTGAGDGGAVFNLSTGAVITSANCTTKVSADDGNGWRRYEIAFTPPSAASILDVRVTEASTRNTQMTGNGVKGILIWGAHLYRSDLGGMVDNPDTGNSYVPTTSAARYLPRRGHHIYNGSAWVNEGVLVESEARTNLLTYSNDFTQWTNQKSADAVASGVVSPDGTENTTEIVEYATTGNHSAFFVQVVASANWTASCYIKQKTSGRYVQLRPYGLGVGVAWATFDPSDGTLYESGGANLVTTTSEPAGNGWYRVSFTCSSALLAGDGIEIVLTDGTTGEGPEYTGDGASGIYVYGAQLEAGSTPSSYIPTSGSTVTRASDTITVPYANLPYSATAMSIQMDGTVTGNSYTPTRWYLDANNAILQDIGSTDFTFTQEAAGVVDTVTGGSFTSGINTPFNIASRHGSNFINGAVSGTALTANTTPTALPDLSATDLQLGFDYMGTIKTLRMWANDLGDTGIAEASA